MGSFASHRIPETSKQWFSNGQVAGSHGAAALRSSVPQEIPGELSPERPAESAVPNGHARSEDELINMILQLQPAERDLIKDLIKISIHKNSASQ